jgi:hypothetical protein
MYIGILASFYFMLILMADSLNSYKIATENVTNL